jgi:hypothetical protein
MPRTTDNTPLVTVEAPTRQQIFDAVVNHAATMTRHCKRPGINGPSVYRGQRDEACFIGCLLTDEEAASLDAADFPTFYSAYVKGMAPERLTHQDLIDLLCDLQDIHDGMGNLGLWPHLLYSTGEDYNLNTDRVTEHWPCAMPVSNNYSF